MNLKLAIIILIVIAAVPVAPLRTNSSSPIQNDQTIHAASKTLQSTPSTTSVPSSAISMNSTVIGPGWESSVTVNPVNPSNILVTGGRFQNSDYFTVASASSDGGRTWRNGVASYSYLNSVIRNGWEFFDQVGTFDANGNAYVGTIDNGTMDWLFKSSDSGNSWLLTSPSLKKDESLLDYGTGAMVHPCNNPPAPNRDYPAVIADPYTASPYRNDVYVLVRTGAQVSPTSCPFGEAFERSTDGGKTWGSGMWLGPPGFASDISLADNRGMAVAPDGTVFLAIGNIGGYFVLKSTDGGVSFQETSVNAPQITVDLIEVAAASATTIYAVLYGQKSTDSCCSEHLYSVVSHDGGNSWSSPVRIDDVTYPDSTHVAAQYHPMWDLSRSQQTGRLDVAWLDWRSDAGNLTLADIYYSYSFDGLSWATNIRATQGPYYYCTGSSPTNCTSTGNDFLWVTSSYTPNSDSAYIVASMGATPCGIHCTNVSLYTRFVKVIFPPTPNTADALHVTNAAIQNSLGRDVTLLGLNYGDYPNDVLPDQFNTGNLTQDAVNIKKAGLNEVNLVEEWGHLESSASASTFTYDAQAETQMLNRINALTGQGLYVVVKLHADYDNGTSPQYNTTLAYNRLTSFLGPTQFCDLPGEFTARLGDYMYATTVVQNATDGMAHLTKLWQEISRITASNPLVVGYDLLNYPQTCVTHKLSSTTLRADWHYQLNILINSLRQSGDNRILFIQEAPFFEYYGQPTTGVTFTSINILDKNWVSDMHFYKGEYSSSGGFVACFGDYKTLYGFWNTTATQGNGCSSSVPYWVRQAEVQFPSQPFYVGEYGNIYRNTRGDLSESWNINATRIFVNDTQVVGWSYWASGSTGTWITDILQTRIPPGLPQTASVSPKQGYPNAQITVNGQYFTGTMSVTVCGISTPFVLLSDMLLLTVAPSGISALPRTCDVQVTTGIGTSLKLSSDQFTIQAGSITGGIVAMDMHEGAAYCNATSCSGFISTTSPNDVIVVIVSCHFKCDPAVADTAGSIYQIRTNQTGPSGSLTSSISEFYMKASGGLLTLDKITVTTSGNGSVQVEFLALANVGMAIWDPTPSLPTVVYHNNTQGSTTNLTISTSPTYSNNLILVPMTINDGGACYPAPSPFTVMDQGGGNSAFYYYQASTSLDSLKFSCNSIDLMEVMADAVCSVSSCGNNSSVGGTVVPTVWGLFAPYLVSGIISVTVLFTISSLRLMGRRRRG